LKWRIRLRGYDTQFKPPRKNGAYHHNNFVARMSLESIH
jgi:hypothetical protein